jgi:aromatic-L-amino-acid/L-tryptophan decarboxylase
VDSPRRFSDLSWSAERATEWAARAAALWSELLEALPSKPVARAWADGEVRKAVALDIPAQPLSDDAIFGHLRDLMFDYSVYPGHPRFMGYISGPGTVPGAIGDLLAAVLNQNLGGWRLSPAATEIELALVRWFAGRFGLPDGSGGLLSSGGAMANFTCLKVARDRGAGWNVRSHGMRAHPALLIYASGEVHAVVRRAADMLGLGIDAIRDLPVDERYRLRVDALKAAIARDRAAGMQPLAVVGSAGTTATGSIDALDEIAGVCEREGLWFHVDAAYGGPAILAPDLRPLLDGIERADSIAFDPHKWLYTPLSGGCALFRDISHAYESFHTEASYTVEDVERTGTTFDFGSHGPQWSRGFWALKIWLSLLAHGEDAYAERISHDAELARYLAARVEAHPELELAAPPSLGVCCFRYVPPELELSGNVRETYLDELNARLMTDVQLDGRAYCSNAVLAERFVLRACIVNFRTEAEDVDELIDVVCELGARAHRERNG